MNYQTLIMMLKDAPRYVTPKKENKNQSAEEEAKDIVGFFQSRFNE